VRICFFAILAWGASIAFGQSACPIELLKVDPHSIPLSSGLLGSDKDPWDHYLRIEYKNSSSKTIIAIRFGVAFVNAMAEANESVYSYDSSEIVKPGKTTKPYWGDGVYFNQYGYRMAARAWLEKVRYSDNTFFVDDGSRSCAFPPRPREATPSTAQFGLDQAKANSEAFKSSPAAAAALANVGHVLTPEEIEALVQKGQASKCAVVTVPPGAEVEIDGNKAGTSPFAVVLLRQGDKPRRLTIRLSGYKTVEKEVLPDGKVIPIAVTLEKQ
jgi:hypothetical protein